MKAVSVRFESSSVKAVQRKSAKVGRKRFVERTSFKSEVKNSDG